MEKFVGSTEQVEENLIKAISGYKGYQSPVHRNKTDKSLRKYLSSQLNDFDKWLLLLEKQIQSRTDQPYEESLKRIRSGLKMIINALQKPCYIDQDSFNKTKFGSEKLAQLYQYDQQLKEQIEILNEESEQAEVENDQEIDEMLNYIYDLIDGINQTLTEREFLIMTDKDITDEI